MTGVFSLFLSPSLSLLLLAKIRCQPCTNISITLHESSTFFFPIQLMDLQHPIMSALCAFVCLTAHNENQFDAGGDKLNWKAKSKGNYLFEIWRLFIIMFPILQTSIEFDIFIFLCLGKCPATRGTDNNHEHTVWPRLLSFSFGEIWTESSDLWIVIFQLSFEWYQNIS